MKKILVVPIALLLLLSPVALADDPAPAAPVASEAAAPAEPATAEAAPAEDVKPPDSGIEDPGGHVNAMVEAAHKKEWGVFVGLGLMLIVWVIGFFWKSLPGWSLPWLAAGLGILGTVGVDLAAGIAWWRAILAGFTTGASAAGLWEMIVKRIFGKRSEKLAAQKA